MSKARDIADSAATINVLDGVTATATELNYVDGVTSAIQTQLDGKETADATIVKDADIGSTVQAYDSNLTSFVGTFTLPTSDGTVDQVLKTNASGVLSFGDAGGGGAWEYLSTVTASGATEIDVEWTYGSHEAYMIILNDYTPSANGASFAYLKLNSAYRSSGYNFHLMRPNSSSGSYSAVTGTNDSSIRVFDQATSNTNYPASLKFIVWNANQNTQYTTYNWIGNGLFYDNITPSDSLLYNYVGGGIQIGDYGVSGVRFDRGSGTQSGTAFLYGLKTS